MFYILTALFVQWINAVLVQYGFNNGRVEAHYIVTSCNFFQRHEFSNGYKLTHTGPTFTNMV